MGDTAVDVSPEQRDTRRRALGRKLESSAKKVLEEAEGVAENKDRQFLSERENELLEKVLAGANTIGNNLRKLATRLDSK